MTPRQELTKIATELGLEFKKNSKTEVIPALVDIEIERINSIILDIPTVNEDRLPVNPTYCGKHPVTGEAVYK